MSTNSRKATLILVLVTVLWGLSFPLMKIWQNIGEDIQKGDLSGESASQTKQTEAKVEPEFPVGALLSGSTLIAIRMLLAAGILAAIQPGLATRPTLREHGYGALLGVIFVAGFIFQVWGIGYTTPAMSAFITSLGSAWAPLIAWLCLGIRAPMLTVIGLAIGVAGTVRLGLEPENGWAILGSSLSWQDRGGFGRGEALTLVASVLFGVQILSLDRIGRRVRADHLTIGFFVAGGAAALVLAIATALSGPGLGPWLDWTGTMLTNGKVATALAVLILLPTILAFHWMNIYQPCVPATRAALIYLLEPIFSTCFSIPFKLDQLTARLVEGGSLILAGNLLVELWPRSAPRDP